MDRGLDCSFSTSDVLLLQRPQDKPWSSAPNQQCSTALHSTPFPNKKRCCSAFKAMQNCKALLEISGTMFTQYDLAILEQSVTFMWAAVASFWVGPICMLGFPFGRNKNVDWESYHCCPVLGCLLKKLIYRLSFCSWRWNLRSGPSREEAFADLWSQLSRCNDTCFPAAAWCRCWFDHPTHPSSDWGNAQRYISESNLDLNLIIFSVSIFEQHMPSCLATKILHTGYNLRVLKGCLRDLNGLIKVPKVQLKESHWKPCE